MKKKKSKKIKPAKERTYEAKLWVAKAKDFDGKTVYEPVMTVGVQTVFFGRDCETFKEAKFYLTCMKNLLENFCLSKEIIVKKKQTYPRYTNHK